MCVCVCVCVCVCAYIYILYIYIPIYIHIYVHIYIYICVCMCIYIYIYMYICTRAHTHTHIYMYIHIYMHIYIYIINIYKFICWKVHRLTKILSQNMTKCGLLFNIVPLVMHTFLPSVFQCLDPIGQKRHRQIKCHAMNLSAYEIFNLTIHWLYPLQRGKSPTLKRKKEVSCLWHKTAVLLICWEWNTL